MTDLFKLNKRSKCIFQLSMDVAALNLFNWETSYRGQQPNSRISIIGTKHISIENVISKTTLKLN